MKTLRTHTPCTAPSYLELVQRTAVVDEVEDKSSAAQYNEEDFDDVDFSPAPEDLLPPYTMEEIYEQFARSERDFAEGRYMEASDMIAKLRAKFAQRDAMKATIRTDVGSELAVAV